MAVATVPPASVIGAADGPTLLLGEVVEATLRHNPDIQLAAQQAEIARGALLVSGSTFDMNLSSGITVSRLHATDTVGADAVQKQLDYSVAAQRLFRNGLSLRPQASFTRSGFDTFPGSATRNDASLGVTASLPLWRDRGGVSTASGEQAARHDYASSRLSLRHTTALSVLVAVTTYWDYLAAQRRAQVFLESEQRAERTADRTRVLVEADERTGADLTQVRANLASKRVSRLSAEQAVVEARQQLGLVMGLPAERIDLLPLPSTDFPAFSAQGERPPGEELRRAFERRDDLLAAEQDRLSAEALLAGVHSELRPRLDLSVTTGYRSADTGLGFVDFFAPAFREGPKLDATVQLAFQFPAPNSRARGRLLQSAAAVGQRRILIDDLRRRVATGVAVALQALARAAAGVRESEEAVRLSDSTVQSEARKFELGVSTLFDVIQAEDGLTSALLGQIQSRRNYAVAIVALRFQGGLLVEGEHDREVRVSADDLLTPP